MVSKQISAQHIKEGDLLVASPKHEVHTVREIFRDPNKEYMVVWTQCADGTPGEFTLCPSNEVRIMN